MRFRYWAMYGERGLAHRRVAVWLLAEEPLAQYAVIREPAHERLRAV